MIELNTGAGLGAAETYATTLLRGDRVRLRAVQQDDLAPLSRWWEDPRVAINQTTTTLPRPDEDVAERLRGWTRNEAAGKGVAFAVETLDGELVGWTALFGSTYPHRSAELGITIDPERTGQGLGGEVLRLVLRFAFQELGLHRVQLEVFAYNERGIRAYEREGFTREGVRRDAMFRGGAFHDVILMGVLEHEWRSHEHASRATSTDR